MFYVPIFLPPLLYFMATAQGQSSLPVWCTQTLFLRQSDGVLSLPFCPLPTNEFPHPL